MFTTAAQMTNRWATWFVDHVAADVMEGYKNELVQMNRVQLLKGQSAKGGFLTPLIIDDPFFKTREAALQYIAWKKRITPQTPEGVANLFINGYTHSKIEALIRDDTYAIQFKSSGLPWGKSVETKYQGQQLGLNEEHRRKFWKETLRTPFVRKVAQITKCRIIR